MTRQNKITKVKKRDGTIVDFDQDRITNAIHKAITAVSQGNGKKSKRLSEKVVKILNRRFKKDEIPQVEQIQDIVEEVLILENLVEPARAYILYRDQRRKIREAVGLIDESVEMIDKYIGEIDWQVKENANMTYSLQGLNQYTMAAAAKKYWLNKIYPKEIKEAAINEDFHIHNLDTLSPYCAGWDLYDLLSQGFGGVPSKIESRPAKHFRTALGQLVNFLFTLQGETAGANAVSNFDTLLAPFIRYDNLTYPQVKQSVQEFLYNCMVPTRVGFQTPFLNISLDIKVPEFYKKQPVIIGGEPQKETYAEFQEEMNTLVRAFYEGLMEGDAKGRVMTFPIPTVSITKDFEWDNPALDPLWEATAKYGVNYFSNFINSDMSPEDVRSMCKLPGTEIIYRNAEGEIAKTEIRRIVDDFLMRGNPIETLINGEFKPVKDVIKLKLENEEILKLTLDNGLIDKMTLDHPSLIIKNGKLEIVESRNLKIGDEFPIAKYPYRGELGDFGLGRLIGLYAGDGWISHDGATFNLVFNSKENELIKFVSKITEDRFAVSATVSLNKEHNYGRISVASRGLVEIMKEYVRGGGALNKRLNSKVFGRSVEFRKGALIGLIESDGSVSKQRNDIVLHLGNKELVSDAGILARSLGVNTTFFESKNRTGEKTKIGYTLRFSVDYPDWILNYFSLKKGKNQKYKEYGDFYGIKITKTEREKYTGYVYDFEINSKEHSFQLANGIITHNCCRLRIDNKELYKRGGGLFGSAPLTGSIGVVTINMPRIGYLSKTKKEFFERLGYLMDLAKESLEIKRKALENFIDKGLYPYSKHYLSSVKKMRGVYFGNHFATIGLLGMNEALLNFLGENIAAKRGKKFTLEVLDFMREKLVKYQEETGNLYNLEATPAEGTTYRQAKTDKEKYPDIITAGTKQTPYYTNSTHLPVNFTNDAFEALKLQDESQCRYNGGTVLHLFLGERLYDIQSVKNLIKTVFEKFHLPYITLTPTFSICPTHGYIAGEHFFCPQCAIKQPCEIYSRIVGYLRPIQQWNAGKQQEFKERKEYKLKVC